MTFALPHETHHLDANGKSKICRGPVMPVPNIDAWIGQYFKFKCIYGCDCDEMKMSKLEIHIKECP